MSRPQSQKGRHTCESAPLCSVRGLKVVAMGLGRRAMVYLGLAEEDEGYLDDEYEAMDEPVRERPIRRVDLEERAPETGPPRRVASWRLEPRADHGSNLARMPEPMRAV